MKIKPSSTPGRVVVELGSTDPKMFAEPRDSSGEPSLFRLRKILVPVDFSDCSSKALQYAISFGRQFDATISLAHVVQVNYGASEFGLVDIPVLERQMRDGAVKQLTELIEKELPAPLRAEAIVSVGRPATEIAALAKEREIDLIIIATHGHTGFRHVLLGSTAENVVRHAPCPVLTVREHEHEFIAPLTSEPAGSA